MKERVTYKIKFGPMSVAERLRWREKAALLEQRYLLEQLEDRNRLEQLGWKMESERPMKERIIERLKELEKMYVDTYTQGLARKHEQEAAQMALTTSLVRMQGSIMELRVMLGPDAPPRPAALANFPHVIQPEGDADAAQSRDK